MAKYTINYFAVSGRAEPARMLFALAGQEYTNNMFAGEEWAKIKCDSKRFPLNQMPTLEVDDKIICQSGAIYRYLANEFGFYGSSNMERCLIDQICETLNDIFADIIKIRYTAHSSDEKKKELYAELFTSAPMHAKLKFMQDMLKEHGNGYFVGDKISLADLVFFSGCELMDSVFPAALDGYPELKSNQQKFVEHDKIKAHIAARKY